MIELLVRKRKITLLFFVMITVVGFLSFFQLPKQEYPNIIVNAATVTTIYPGASPEKVEQTITKKIEERINQLSGLKTVNSTSSLGVSIIVIESEDGVDPKQKWDELRKKVKDAEADLPEDAKQPIINDDLNRSFIQTFNIYTDSKEKLYETRDLVKSWKDQFRTIKGIADVTIDGLPEKQVRVELDTQKLQQYGIVWGQVFAAIQKENDMIPLGNYNANTRTYQLDIDQVDRIDQFTNTLVTRTREGNPVYLKDVASIQLSTERPKQYVYYNGKPAISLSLNAEVGKDIPSLQAKVEEMMKRLTKDKPTWLKVESVYTQNERVHELFSELIREMSIAVLSVIFVCTLGLNMITSLVVALAIPISIAVGLIPLPSMGVGLNQISIVALIIVLGILVDDAVVVNDNIERRLSVLGESPSEAAVRGSKEVSISILTATLATICSFAPLFFLQGNVGQFIRPIPVIIGMSMLASMAVSLTIIPIFRQWYESKKKGDKNAYRKPAGLLGKQIHGLTQWYANRLMPRILKRPLLVGLVGILVGLSAFALVPYTPVELFPSADRAEMFINIKGAPGSNVEATDTLAKEVTKWLQAQPGVKMISTYVGSDAPKMFSGDTGLGSGENICQMVLRLDTDKVKTKDVIGPWTQELNKRFPGATITPKELDVGPPVGDPVSIRIYGEDLVKLRNLSNQVKNAVVSTKGTKEVEDSFGIDRYTLHFTMNKAEMDRLMINPNDVSKAIRMVSEGLTITEFDDGKDLVDIVMYAHSADQDPSSVFQRLTVPNALGQQVPLYQIVNMEPAFSLSKITHYNLSRNVTVHADVKGRTATEVMGDIKTKLDKMNWPVGYRYEIGGETSEQADIFVSMGKLSIVVLFLILILVATQFYSLSTPLLVLSTVFLATAGSCIGLFVTHTPIGFMSMMGVISLAGIVVRNGIVLVEFIEESRHHGLELKEAVIQAVEARLRPILLTSATAVSGLTPLALTGDVLFKPMAITIIFGLVFSTLLTLLVVPSMYMVIARYKMKRMKRKEKSSVILQDVPEKA